MAVYDWVGASAARVERANDSPAETLAADGKLAELARRHAGAGPALPHGHGHADGERELPEHGRARGSGLHRGRALLLRRPSPGHCGEWSFPRSGTLPALQTKFLAQMKRLFAADIADWRPNGGSMCEQAVVMAACKAGDAFVELAPEDGGHFGAAVLAERLGIDSFAFPMRGDLIDVEATANLVEQHPSIRLVLVQPSHCRRPQPIEELAGALPAAGHARGRCQPYRRSDRGGAAAPASAPGRGHPHVQHAQDACRVRTRASSRSPTATIRLPRRCGTRSARSFSRTATPSVFQGW